MDIFSTIVFALIGAVLLFFSCIYPFVISFRLGEDYHITSIESFKRIIIDSERHSTHQSRCWNCKHTVDGDTTELCPLCGWVICPICHSCCPSCSGGQNLYFIKSFAKNHLESLYNCVINNCTDKTTRNIYRYTFSNKFVALLKLEIKASYKENQYVDGIDIDGFDANGYDAMGYNKSGYNKSGFDRQGYDKDGFSLNGFNRNGFDRNGVSNNGTRFNDNGYDIDGFDADGFDVRGYNRSGYNTSGYDRLGLDSSGFNKLGFDKEGFDHLGYNKYGYDRDGYNRSGFNRDGLNQTGTYFDDNGFNYNGFDINGYDRNGYDKSGFDIDGFNKNGIDRDGYNRDGLDKFKKDRDGYFEGLNPKQHSLHIYVELKKFPERGTGCIINAERINGRSLVTIVFKHSKIDTGQKTMWDYNMLINEIVLKDNTVHDLTELKIILESIMQ